MHYHLDPAVGEIAAGVANEVVMMAFIHLKAAVQDDDSATAHRQPLEQNSTIRRVRLIVEPPA
jgi:hypothetical protein